MKIQCVILAVFLSIFVICIKPMTYANVFGLESLLSLGTGTFFSASTKWYRVYPTRIKDNSKYRHELYIISYACKCQSLSLYRV